MSRTITAETLEESAIRPGLTQPIHEIAEGVSAEHIYMGGEDEASAPARPDIVCDRHAWKNRVQGIHTEIVFYEEGFLRIREHTRNKLSKDHLLDLRFLNPIPKFTRHVSTRVLYSALGLSAGAGLAWLIAELTSLARFFGPAAVVFATAALVAYLLFVYRTRETNQFFTAKGQAAVITLMATFGCYRRCRSVVPQIRRAIEDMASGNNLGDTTYLREEMREHYRLRESGVISPESCAEGTRKILSEFG